MKSKESRLREQVLAVGTQFEGLLAEVTITLDDLHVDELDGGIKATLREIALFFHADGAFVVSADHGGERCTDRAWADESEAEEAGSSAIGSSDATSADVGCSGPEYWTWEATRLPDERSLAVVVADEADGLRRTILHRQVAIFPTAADVPEPFRRVGVRSLVFVPLAQGETLVGGLGVLVRHRERPWSDGLLRRVRLLGDRLAAALERRGTARRREAASRFERLLAELTSTLLDRSLEEDDPDLAIENALQAIAEVAGGDRVVLFRVNEGGTGLESEHLWVDDTLDPPRAGDYRREGALRWLAHRLARGETVPVDRVADLPASAARERRHFRSAGVRSLVRVPLSVAGRVVAVLGVDATETERRWSEEVCERLRLVGRLLLWSLDRASQDGHAAVPGAVMTTAAPVAGVGAPMYSDEFPGLPIGGPSPPGGSQLPSLDRLPVGASVVVLDDPDHGRELVLRLPLEAQTGGTSWKPSAPSEPAAVLPAPDATNLQDVERTHILGVLQRCRWKINGFGNAAERLGLAPSTLRYRMRKLGLARPTPGNPSDSE